MNTRFTLAALALTLFAAPALGTYQVVPFWQYNVTLDFGDKAVTIEAQPSRSDMDSLVHSTIFRGDNESDWGAIYIYEYQNAQTLDLEDRLWRFMKGYCALTETDPGTVCGTNGFVAYGYARVAHGFGKQVCYAGAITLPGAAASQRDFTVFGHFGNAAQNEQFVKTARIEFSGKSFAI